MDTTAAAKLLSALGQTTRFDILRIVAPHSRGQDSYGLPAGDIGRALGIPPATLSFHLREMTYKGLLSQSRFGRSIYYRADIEALLDTLDYLVSEVCGS
jgi:ArsR family transcriptional regulator, arsenate/arsenite/antimonite-responsive transcriptional repressor